MSIQAARARLQGWADNPLPFFADELKFDMSDPWQVDFISKLASQDPKCKQIALKACTGPGKSAVLAGSNLWFVATHGGKDKTRHPQGAVTSINESNVNSGVWKQIAAWRGRSEFLMQQFEFTATKLFQRDHPDTWFVEKKTWGTRADPEAQGRTMSGIHGPYVLWTIDEAGDIPIAILRVAQQIFSSAHDWAKILIAGNPTSLSGVLYYACVHEAHRTYAISISADPDDPNRAKRTDLEHAKAMIAQYGRTNPWVLATILGQFPPMSANALLGIEEVEAAMRRHYPPEAYDWAQKRLGVDCARFGDDRTVLAPRQGLVWFKPVEMRAARTDAIAARIIQACHRWAPHNPQDVLICVDQTGGWGQGTCDQLRVAGFSPMEFVYSTPATMDEYFRMRSQGWMEMAKHVRAGAALPPIASLKAELTEPTYTLKDGKLFVEPKELFKARLGFSPDLADAWATTYMLPDMPQAAQMQRLRSRRVENEYDPYEERESLR